MTETHIPSGLFPARVVRWRIFVFLAVAAARGLLRLERAGSGEVWARAGELELIARAGFAEVNRQIADACAEGEPGDPGSAHALGHLRLAALCLLALALFARHLRGRLAARGVGQAASDAWLSCARIARASGRACAPGYLDSS